MSEEIEKKKLEALQRIADNLSRISLELSNIKVIVQSLPKR
ncbi:hypothetical protein A33M_3350 [Rhodovulum sp. PH10]|nr:hypothetical protein A33M_3350 [Rhodovulum sp. PH10]